MAFVNQCLRTAASSPIRSAIFNTSTRALSVSGSLKTLKTHTGQEFAPEDFRNNRFERKSKTVNDKFAIDLINEIAPEETKSRVVWCDGGSGATGHPRVFINLDKPGNHECKYCGLRFLKDGSHH